jgi:hypothetical protein
MTDRKTALAFMKATVHGHETMNFRDILDILTQRLIDQYSPDDLTIHYVPDNQHNKEHATQGRRRASRNNPDEEKSQQYIDMQNDDYVPIAPALMAQDHMNYDPQLQQQHFPDQLTDAQQFDVDENMRQLLQQQLTRA